MPQLRSILLLCLFVILSSCSTDTVVPVEDEITISIDGENWPVDSVSAYFIKEQLIDGWLYKLAIDAYQLDGTKLVFWIRELSNDPELSGPSIQTYFENAESSTCQENGSISVCEGIQLHHRLPENVTEWNSNTSGTGSLEIIDADHTLRLASGNFDLLLNPGEANEKNVTGSFNKLEYK